MRLTKAEYASLALAVLTAAVPILAWSYVPPSVPVWWGLSLLPDIQVAKPWGPLVLPAISIAIWGSTLAHKTRGDPQARSAITSAAGRTSQFGAQTFLLILTLAPIMVSAGLAISVDHVAAFGLGLLLVVAGNVQGKLRRNTLWGMRTPWALGSDEVWLRTQRLAGWLMTISGIAWLVAVFAGRGLAIAAAILLVSILATVCHSFLIHRSIAKASEHERA